MVLVVHPQAGALAAALVCSLCWVVVADSDAVTASSAFPVRSVLNVNISENNATTVHSIQVNPVTFTPSSYATRFWFVGSTVNITNVTTEAEACGFICPGRVDGELINGVLGLSNASSPSNGIRMTAMCQLVVGNTTSETQVCTAFIRYNASYVENGTVYALPVNRTVTLDPRTRVIAQGYTFPLWLWIEMSVCPWYYDDPSIVVTSGIAINISSLVPLAINNSDGTPPPRVDETELSGVCEAAFRADRGIYQARIAVNATASSIYDVFDGAPLSDFHTAFIRVVMVSHAVGAIAQLLPTNITVLDLMNVSMSSWQPMENYSEAPLATQPRRCYNTQPRATDGSPSTVWAGRTACTVYPGYIVRLDIEFLNATALCCSVPNATSPVVWSSPIEVWVNGARWFFDNAGIAGDPSPTAVPDSGKAPPRGYTNSSAPAAQPDATTDAPVGGSVGSSAGDGESAAIVIGAVLAAVCAVIAVGAVLYTAVWKRYRAAQSTKEQREDALREVMNGHGEDASFGAAATAPGTLEAELLGEYHRDHVDL